MVQTPPQKRQQRRAEIGYARNGQTGAAGLFVSVIAQATADYFSPNRTVSRAAAAWFRSKEYRVYLEILGLPVTWLPDGVEEQKLS